MKYDVLRIVKVVYSNETKPFSSAKEGPLGSKFCRYSLYLKGVVGGYVLRRRRGQ